MDATDNASSGQTRDGGSGFDGLEQAKTNKTTITTGASSGNAEDGENETENHPAYNPPIITSIVSLISAMFYTLGSLGFIWSSWDSNNWLLPCQWACGIWIWGCLFFLLAIFVDPLLFFVSNNNPQGGNQIDQDFRNFASCPSLSQVYQSLSASSFLIGCCFAFGSESDVIENLAIINALFLVGSLALLMDLIGNLFQMYVSLKHSHGQGNRPRMTTLELVLDAVVALSFVFAAILGGYGQSDNHVRIGMPGWTIGSIASGILPTQQICRGHVSSPPNVAVKQQQAKTTHGDEPLEVEEEVIPVHLQVTDDGDGRGCKSE